MKRTWCDCMTNAGGCQASLSAAALGEHVFKAKEVPVCTACDCMYVCDCIRDDESPSCCKHVHVIHSIYNSLAIATGHIPSSFLEENALPAPVSPLAQ